MNDINNNWKKQMDDPSSFEGFISADAKKRIAKKIFPADSKKMFPRWLSHAAAVLCGILIGGVYFYKNSDPQMPIDTTTHTKKDSVNNALVASDSTSIAQQKSVQIHVQNTTINRANSYKPEHISKTDTVVLNPIIEENTLLLKENLVQNQEIPTTEPVVVIQKTKKSVPVSDIVKTHHKKSFNEKTSETLMAHQNSNTETSPFKFLK